MVTKRVPRRPTEDEIDAIMPPEGPGPAVEGEEPSPFDVEPVPLGSYTPTTMNAVVLANRPKFEPREHMMKMRGKDYLEVRYRLYWLRLDHPDAIIETECVRYDDKEATFRAKIGIPGSGIATGHKTVKKGEFAKYYEKAETGAIGRALAHLGYGTLEGGEDVDEGAEEGGLVDTPTKPISGKQSLAKPAGFPPVTWEGQKLVNMPDVRKAMFACIDSENRKVLFRKIKGTDGWENALDEIKVYWGEADDFDSDMEPREE